MWSQLSTLCRRPRPFGILLLVFLAASWPFIHFPLTDGDISHWVDWASQIANTGQFLATESDQAHGPMLAWGSAIILKILGASYYAFNGFNLVCSLGIFYLIYSLIRDYESDDFAYIGLVFASISLGLIYMSRTPMYDWPATTGYFGFCVTYARYLRESNDKAGLWALLFLSFGALSRLSIVVGLSGIFMLQMRVFKHLLFTESRDWLGCARGVIKDSLGIILVPILVYLPWIFVQAKTFPGVFLPEFLNDNLLRFIRDHAGDPVQKDYLGFFFNAILAMLPLSPLLLAGLMKEGRALFKTQPLFRLAVASSLPCIIIFSFSGHTKMLRYISYSFPGLVILASCLYKTLHSNTRYQTLVRRYFYLFLGFIALVFAYFIVLFQVEAAASSVLSISALALVLAVLLFMFLFFNQRLSLQRLLYFSTAAYLLFFTLLSMEYTQAPFLVTVDQMIQGALNK